MSLIGVALRGSEIHRQLQPTKAKVRFISRLYSSKRRFIRPPLLASQSALVLKVGLSYGW